MTTVKPSNTKNWDVVRHFPGSKLSQSAKALKEPNIYAYYLSDDGTWHPHRKPTVSEIINDKFK